MTPKLIIYRLITFILLPIAAILGFVGLLTLMSGFSNPGVLLDTFIIGSLVFYMFASFVFFSQGIAGAKRFKPSLKDWIKVNAYVSLIYSVIVLVAAILFFTVPDFQKAFVDKIIEMQKSLSATPADREIFIRLLRSGLLFSAAFSILLGTHIIITLGFVKKYDYLFGKKEDA